ncbi:translation initiation factor IF-2 [Alkalispirochaeta sphaeroplastigenens]|uniref:Translation initiation factor IF-2 n=1 Tax=Alkalispirochaeta sphaeroplastigenens TaxID=1187066 RepID=A0A2S4JFA1_9SPIO|nr:translation initiation factor IF-2 [Alkalispirochaeta sphaeroplastigenens]POQ98238.1 translation initiation factor IF-2 [Alkalispirochaeta sphaeroplastigenens]
MAEEQDKQKPKATLIKKKPEKPGAQADASPEKKKVRVVVKRKQKPKEDSSAPRETPAAASPGTPPKPAQPVAPAESGQPSRPDSSAASGASAGTGPLAKDTPSAESPRAAESSAPARAEARPAGPAPAAQDGPSSGKPPVTSESPGQGPQKPAASPAQSSVEKPASPGAPSAGSGPGQRPGPRDQAQSADGPPRRRPPQSGQGQGGDDRFRRGPRTGGPGAGPDERRRPGGPGGPGGPRYGGGRPGGPGGPGGPSRGPGGQGGPGGPRYGGGRPGGPGGPGGPSRGPGGQGGPGGPRYGGGRPGGPGGPGGPSRGPGAARYGGGGPGGPGGPPRGPGGSAETGRQPGKKFFKSKKTRGGGFDRDDRVPEKELRYNRKKQPQVKTNPVPKEIDIMEVITVSELARKMNLKANALIGKLMSMGMMVTINQQIDAETAEILASEYGCSVRIVSLYDETIIETGEDRQEDLRPRSPIVTVMGHVDHGKTKLLDAIRSTDVASGEQGGITQHIGAYQVTIEEGTVTFLDTPGHEAFTLMRARGAQVTDIVVLVVAANDGVMPQTVEAIDHAKEAKVPIIVAINKIDLPEANIDRVKQQLSEHGIIVEDWGGDIPAVEVSALKREGIGDLLGTVLVQAEIMELKANFNRSAEGKIVESRIDPGRGTVATVLIENGTLKVGDSFVAGIYRGKIRAMFNDRGQKVDTAGPAMPVEIIGLDGVPDSGDPFQVTDGEKLARQVSSKRQELKRVEAARNVKKVTLDNLYDSIQEGEVQELKVVIKGDVHGSVEALQNALERLSTPEVRLVAIHAAAGAINEGDVMLASASNALVVGFHVRPTPRAMVTAEKEKVEIRKYSIIYDAVEDIRSAMEGMLAPDLMEEVLGTAEVRETFKVPKIGIVAGCYITSGKFTRNAQVRVFREEIQLYESKVNSLKRFKDDVREVETGYECGIGVEKIQDIKVGDILEAFIVKEVAKKL